MLQGERGFATPVTVNVGSAMGKEAKEAHQKQGTPCKRDRQGTPRKQRHEEIRGGRMQPHALGFFLPEDY